MSAQTIWTQASQLITASNVSGPLTVGNYAEIAVDINGTSKQGTSPTIQFFIDRLGVDGIYYPLWQSSTQSTTPFTGCSTSIGAGLAISQSFGGTVQFRWSIGGSSTPGFIYSVSLIGK
jgi:hypothetical protein